MKSLYRNIFLFFGIVAIVVMLLTFDMDYRELWANVRQAGYWFFAVMGVWVFIYFFNALSWFFIIRGGESDSPVPFWKVYKLSISGFALNYATPFGLMGGEPYRIMELSPYVGVPKATSSVILYVMMHIFSHVCFWLCSIVLYLCMYSLDVAMGIFLGLTSAVLLLLVYFFVLGYKNGMVVKTFRMLSRIPFVKGWAVDFYEAKKDTLMRIDSQIAELHGQRRTTFYASFFTEFFARFLTSVEIFFILKILAPEVNFLDCVLIMAFTSLFANVLFFSPMQLGAREGGFALAVSGLCLSGAFGVYAGLISRVRELLWIIIGVSIMKIGNHATSCPLEGVKGLMFDYGGTLDSGGRHWAHVIWEGYQKTRVPVSEEQFREAYVYAERYLASNLVISPQDDFLQLMQKKIHLQMQYLQLDEQYESSVAIYCYNYARQEIDRTRQVLHRLKGKIPMVLVTNFYGNIHSVLADFGLLPYFDDVIESAVVGVRKPSLQIWQLGLKALGVKAQDVCVVGDSFPKDIEPTMAIGCKTVWYKGDEWIPAKHDESFPTAIITDIQQLPSLILG